MNPQTLIDKARILKGEAGELTYNDLVGDELTDEEVMNLHLALDDLRATVNRVTKAFDAEVVRRIEARGRPMEVSGYLITTKVGYTRERCVDQAGFLSWLLEYPSQGLAAINPNNLRFGSLPPAVRDTFFSKEDVVKPDAQPKPAAIPVEVLNRRTK